MDITNQKVPGCSLLEHDGKIYEFEAGDESHPYYKEIYEMVVQIGKNLKRVGYAVTISEMLLHLVEEDKRMHCIGITRNRRWLCIAVLRPAPGMQIRIAKNLHVCVDCHSATKLISKVYGREILVRDRSRFHRLKDGEHSCKDF